MEEDLLLAHVIFVISCSFITGNRQEEEKLYLLHFCKILGNRYAGHEWYFTFKTQLAEQEKNRSGDTDSFWRLIASFP